MLTIIYLFIFSKKKFLIALSNHQHHTKFCREEVVSELDDAKNHTTISFKSEGLYSEMLRRQQTTDR
jgi:hypothetical protein